MVNFIGLQVSSMPEQCPRRQSCMCLPSSRRTQPLDLAWWMLVLNWQRLSQILVVDTFRRQQSLETNCFMRKVASPNIISSLKSLTGHQASWDQCQETDPFKQLAGLVFLPQLFHKEMVLNEFLYLQFFSLRLTPTWSWTSTGGLPWWQPLVPWPGSRQSTTTTR